MSRSDQVHLVVSAGRQTGVDKGGVTSCVTSSHTAKRTGKLQLQTEPQTTQSGIELQHRAQQLPQHVARPTDIPRIAAGQYPPATDSLGRCGARRHPYR